MRGNQLAEQVIFPLNPFPKNRKAKCTKRSEKLKNEEKEKKKKQPNRTRKKQIAIRLSEKEYEKLMEQVRKSGMTQQDFFSKVCMEKEIKNLDGLKELIPEIKRIGNNINQIAKKCNQEDKVLNDDVMVIKKELDDIWQLLNQYIVEQA